METFGLIRRIDKLGRIVIPREIRKVLKIKSGETFKLFMDDENIIIQKHSYMKNIPKLLINLFYVIKKTYKSELILTDLSSIVYSSIDNLLETNNNILSEEYYNKIIKGKRIQESKAFFLSESYNVVNNYCFVPINVNGDYVGSLLIIKKGNFEKEDNVYINIIYELIVNYLEQ